jgi:hypothetical protein
MVLAFLNAGGLFWVTHLSEAGRLRLRQFEREFALGHEHEKAGDFAKAVQVYASLVPKFSDQPKIAEIAHRRIQSLKQAHPDAFKASTPAKAKARPTPKGRRR